MFHISNDNMFLLLLLCVCWFCWVLCMRVVVVVIVNIMKSCGYEYAFKVVVVLCTCTFCIINQTKTQKYKRKELFEWLFGWAVIICEVSVSLTRVLNVSLLKHKRVKQLRKKDEIFQVPNKKENTTRLARYGLKIRKF